MKKVDNSSNINMNININININMLVQRVIKNEVIIKREEGENVLAKIDLKIKDHVEKRKDEEKAEVY